MRFVQTIAVNAADPEALAALMTEWHEAEHGTAPGYQGSRLLADRDHPGRYLMVIDFASAEEAERNNDRPETAQWGAKLTELISSEPLFGNYEEAHSVG